MAPNRLNILIAHAAQDPWAVGLAGGLRALPVDLYWSRSEEEVVGLARRQVVHLGVVDDAIPETGGLGLLRRIRRLGFDFPCLLISQEPSQRLLLDALALEVITVIQPDAYRETLMPSVLSLIRRRYNVAAPGTEHTN